MRKQGLAIVGRRIADGDGIDRDTLFGQPDDAGLVTPDNLEYYLDEYTFPFNRRTSRSRGMLFYRLIQQAVMTSPLPYRQIVERKRKS